MLTPVHTLHAANFFALGNTPPVNLLSHQDPGKEVVDMLLLGCGDARNILYTVFRNENGRSHTLWLCTNFRV
jgi:Domain of unknown function (DUF4470)